MTLERLLNCARSVYLETDIEGIDYGQNGTCTLLKGQGRLIVVTARHCLWQTIQPTEEEIRYCIEHLWVPQTLTASQPESFGLCNPRVVHSPTHQAASDLAVVDVLQDPPPLTTDFCDLASFPLADPTLGDKLVIAGYPRAINNIEYPHEEHGKLILQKLITSGVHCGEGTAPGLQEMKPDEPGVLSSYNGMSGSPVFTVRKTGDQTFALFAGVAVRQMAARGTIDLIPASIVRGVLFASANGSSVSEHFEIRVQLQSR